LLYFVDEVIFFKYFVDGASENVDEVFFFNYFTLFCWFSTFVFYCVLL